MFRRLASLVAAAVLVVGACSSVPAVTDPKEIMTKSVVSLQGLKTAHLKLDVSGSVKLDITGTGNPTALNLQGTTMQGDVNVPDKKAHIAIAVPALLNVTADLIQIADTTYTKISLQGDKYTKSTSASSAVNTDPTKALGDVTTALNKLSSPPTKLGDEKCGSADCYHVQVKVTSADLNAIGTPTSGVSGDGTLDLYTQKSDFRPVKLTMAVNGGDQGNLVITVELSNFDAPVSIDAPSADQIR